VLTVGLGQLMGGFNDHDINDPHVTEILEMLSGKGLAAAPNGFTLKAVQTQVVAGVNYRFIFGDDNRMRCEIDYFEQAWTNTHTVTRDTCKTIVAKQARRMLLAVGGYVAQDVTDPHWAAMLYDLDNTYGLVDFGNAEVKIVDVATQVVSGVNTKYTLMVGGKTCTLVVYEQTWTNTRQISSDTCGVKVTHKRQLGGGWASQDPTDQKWSDMLTMLDTNLNLINLNGAHDLEILAVKSQVVSGMNYNFTLRYHNHICNVVYYEQSWTNTHQITYDSCSPKAVKRQFGMPGGWASQDPTDQKWSDMLTMLDTNLNLINLNGAHDTEILAVKSQVVSGMNYNFTLKYHNHICNIVYYEQSWTNTHQITYDSCSPKAVKRQIGMPGGWASQDPTDQKWSDMLTMLDTNLNLINLDGAHDTEILAVKQQVVSGMNYNFTLRYHNHICNIVYYEQSWTNTHQITYDSCSPKAVKRQLGMPGGWASQDPTDQKWSDMLTMLDTNLNLINLNGAHDTEILAVKQQVVSGMNYNFTLKYHNHICNIVYYEQSWTNTHQITYDSCSPKAVKRQFGMPGGWASQDPTDQKWSDMLTMLDTNLNLINLNGAHDTEILAVKQQVVSGMNYNFTLKYHNHICNIVYYEQSWTNTHQITYDSCSPKAVKRAGGWVSQDPTDQKWSDMLTMLDTNLNLIHLNGANDLEIMAVKQQVVSGMKYDFTLRIHNQVCNLVYYEQSWTNTHQISSDTCNIAVHKRQLAGGYTKQDASDPKWANLLQELDQQYHLIDLQGDNGMQILGVDTQVVAGMNYKFTLLVNGKQCELVYFEQLWTQTRQIAHDTCGIRATHSKRSASASYTFTTSGTNHGRICLGNILDRINAQSNNLFRMVDAQDPQTQVSTSNGETSATFRIQLGESACINNADNMGSTAAECPPSQNSNMHSVWEGKCVIHADGSPNEITVTMVSHN